MTSSAHRTARAVAGAAILAGVAALAAGCGLAATPSAHTGTPPPHTPAPRATSSQPGPSPVNSSTTSPAVPAASACLPGDLRITLAGSEGAAGSVVLVVDFRNTSAATCSLYGYPGVAFTADHSTSPAVQIGQPATRVPGQPESLVTLAPRRVAHTLVQVADAANFPPSRCHPETASYLQIYVPNQRQAVWLPDASPTCASHFSIMTVTPVQPGADRNGS